MFDLDAIAAETILRKLQRCSVGILVTDIIHLNVAHCLEKISEFTTSPLHIAVVGQPISFAHPLIQFSTRIEDAVRWRSTPELAKSIIVIVTDEVRKSHSLGSFDRVNELDIASSLVDSAAATMSDNAPRRAFWNALQKHVVKCPLPLLRNFVDAAYSDRSSATALTDNLWRLGLLKDPALASASNVPDRLERNSQLLTDMALMTNESRRRMSSRLADVPNTERERMRAAYKSLMQFYKARQLETLRHLELDTVRQLIEAGRPQARGGKGKGSGGSGGADGGNGGGTNGGVLRGKKAMAVLSKAAVQGTSEAEATLAQVTAAIREHLREVTDASDDEVRLDLPTGEAIVIPVGVMGPRGTLVESCRPGIWGGIVHTDRRNIDDALAETDKFVPYKPAEPSVANVSLFGALRAFDAVLPDSQAFGPVVERLAEARESLAEDASLLFLNPIVLLGGSPECRQKVARYLDAYATLLRLARQNEPIAHQYDPEVWRLVMAELLRLDVIYVHTPDEWKAVLTPLHPFHLWKYRELFGEVFGGRKLEEEELRQLEEVVPDLPHLMHFLIASSTATGRDSTVLPLSGTVGSVPTFENHTNRYLGTDGLDFIQTGVDRFIAQQNYVAVQLRIALVDPPSILDALEHIREAAERNKCRTVLVLCAYTRENSAQRDLAKLQVSEKDYKLAEALTSGFLSLRLLSCSWAQVIEELREHPVHLTFAFDAAQYHIDHAPRARNLMVSPLVVTYEYEFSAVLNKGTIAPSSEAQDGLFADWHFLIERAALLPAGQQLRLQYDQHLDLNPVHQLVDDECTQWLVIADRSLAAYVLPNVVPLGERRYGQRELGVWAASSPRTVSRIEDMLRRYQLLPDTETLLNIVRHYGHVASGGLLSLSGVGSSTRLASEKAFAGSLLAAKWYTSQYPGALVASLDSNLARTWLQGGRSGKRADLIGVRQDASGTVVFEVIEVKAHSDQTETRVERDEDGQARLCGPAVEQLEATLRILGPLFDDGSGSTLLVPARREILKYQVHRECFRETHDRAWKQEWYERLRDVFNQPAPRVPVQFRGLVIDFKFEEAGQIERVEDSVAAISLVTIRTGAIQRLITPRTEQLEPSTTSCEVSSKESEVHDEPMTESGEGTHTGTPSQQHREADATSSKDADKELSSQDLNEATNLVKAFLRACESYRIQIQNCEAESAVFGPHVWRFYVKLARGQRLSELRNALDDIGREMKRSGLLVSTLPGRDEVALDVPREPRTVVHFSRALDALQKVTSVEELPIAIGVTPEGLDIVRDLGKMPHLLVGGTTGSGKTRLLYSLLLAILKTHSAPGEVQLLLSTSKPEDFDFFEGLPHLLTGQVIYDADEAIRVLEDVVGQTLDARGDTLKGAHCVNIADFNRRNPASQLAPIVVVVDEFADLADQLGRNRARREAFYTNIRRIAQLGRSRGIHLVLCTQRPSADLVPTNIRNLMNCRIALRVNDSTASRMILELPGAEQLQMHGDMLFKETDTPLRLQGYSIEPDELLDTLEKLGVTSL